MLVFLALAVPLYGFVYYGNVRYRLPLEPFMLLVVSRWALVAVRSGSLRQPHRSKYGGFADVRATR